MNSFTREALAQQGFTGFVTFAELREQPSQVSAVGGVYIVLRTLTDPTEFLDSNPGGRFKGRDPSVSVDELRAKWLDEAEVVYIGKGDDIRRRLKQYADFGSGRPIGHWGGRFIWQLGSSDTLLVAWKPCEQDETAAMFEARLIGDFKAEHGGRLPFANISDPSR